VNKNSQLHCYALYYDAETATEEQYAICVTKGNTELLNAINEVLAELGEDGINALVSKHLGITG
jgi:ABC-type amino acid transport substrate-binding protein